MINNKTISLLTVLSTEIVDRICCIICYNENKNLFLSPMSDGPLKFNNNLEGEQNIEVISKFGRSFSIIRVPYSFKLLNI